MDVTVNRLTESAFQATMGSGMERIGPHEAPPFDFWPYFEAIPEEDFGGYDCSSGLVTRVWQARDGRYQHVLVNSHHPDVFMVLVLDLEGRRVFGHRLLDLPSAYGLND